MESQRPVAIVTGGSRGIGAAIVRRLARAGYDLVVTYRSDEAAAERVARSAVGTGARVEPVRADLATDRGIHAPFDVAAERFGRLDALVNNAGVSTRYAPLADTPAEEIRQTIEVDFVAAVLSARLAVQEFQRTGAAGVIVNITSGAATLGSPGEYTHYAADRKSTRLNSSH